MSLTVKWDSGVIVEYKDKRLVFDPKRKKSSSSKVFITHAHFDHCRGFKYKASQNYSTRATKEIVESYGKEVNQWNPLPVRGRLRWDDLEVVSYNAGHVLGSTVFEVITPEGNVVYTGDLQFNDSFTLQGAEPVSCDVLIVDCTFGSRGFRFPEREVVAHDMIRWAQGVIRRGKVPTFQADSLGNAQEVIKAFNLYSDLTVKVHGRVTQISDIYRTNGHTLDYVNVESDEFSESPSSRGCILVTAKNVKLKNHPELEPALVSGFALWARRTAFPLSDHADFGQLMDYIEACNPRTVLTCFGGKRNSTFAREVESQLRIKARPLRVIPTQFFLGR
ncbi:MAG: MBL fold metallo-hydrolase [Thermoproteota archaeon]